MYKVYRTEDFHKEMRKLFSHEEQPQLRHLESVQLCLNPYVGDPLGYKFFREKKFGGKRLYYLIYEDLKAVLLIAVSNKKWQQEVINEVRNNFALYYNIIKEMVRQHDEYDHV